MAKIRIAVLLAVGLAGLFGCGNNTSSFTSRSAAQRAFASSLRYNAQYQDLYSVPRTELLNEGWIAIDDEDRPIQNSWLSFQPHGQGYWFTLHLPDRECPGQSLKYKGEIFVDRTVDDDSLRGMFQWPKACSTAKIWVGKTYEEEGVGTVLPVDLYMTCGDSHAWPKERVKYFVPVSTAKALAAAAADR